LIRRAAAKGHPWPSAAKPASCRFARRINIEFRPAWFNGAPKIKIKIKIKIKSERGGLIADLLVHTVFLWANTEPVGAVLARDKAGRDSAGKTTKPHRGQPRISHRTDGVRGLL